MTGESSVPPTAGPAVLYETQAKSILRRGKTTDSWFISRYGMNLYRGCAHACAYCDGRAETYRVQGEFGRDVQVKVNAAELLRKEIHRVKERAIFFVGGGVCDAYQPAEARYRLAQEALQIIAEHGRPVHVLTKSALVERDLDLLAELARGPGATVSFSFCSMEQEVAGLFEPRCAPVAERLRILSRCRQLGISTGMMLMPVIPFISDDGPSLRQAAAAAQEVGVDFVIFSGMTLKPGRQREHFYRVLKARHPHLLERYGALYGDNRWGQAEGDLYERLDRTFAAIAAEHALCLRIPHRLFRDRVELNVEVAMVLSHINYLLRLSGKRRPAYERAARALQGLDEDLSDMVAGGRLGQIPGVGEVINRLITELVTTRRCEYYEKLLAGPARES